MKVWMQGYGLGKRTGCLFHMASEPSFDRN